MNQKLTRKPILQLVNKILFNGKNSVSQNGGIPYLLFMHLNARNKNICKCKAVTIQFLRVMGPYINSVIMTQELECKKCQVQSSQPFTRCRNSHFQFQFEDYQTNTKQYLLQEIIKTRFFLFPVTQILYVQKRFNRK